MVKLGSFSDGTSSRIEDKLKTICLSGRGIEQKRVAVVKFRMNKRAGGYGTRCGTIDGIADTSEVSNVVYWYRHDQTQQKYDQKKLDCYQRSMTPRLQAESTGGRMTSLGQ